MIGSMGGTRLFIPALVVMVLLVASPPAHADPESPPTSAQGAGNSDGNNGNANGNGNGNGGGNGNGNGHGTSTTTTTTPAESTTTTIETTTTTTVETTTTTTPAPADGSLDGNDSTTTTVVPPTEAPVGPGPAEGESPPTTVGPSTSTTVVLIPVGPDAEPPSGPTSTTTPEGPAGSGTAPPGGTEGGEPVAAESRPAFFADFGSGDVAIVAAPTDRNAGRLGDLFDTWAWSDRGGAGLAGATFEMLAAVLRAIVTAGHGMAVPASVTATLIVLAVVSRHRTSDGAIPSAS
jgi:hypothetical protein